jgi:hypothetical protein
MTFMERLRAGEAWPEDIDDYINVWRLAASQPGLPASASGPLHEFLGMTLSEYGQWRRNPNSLSQWRHAATKPQAKPAEKE